jgi:hypothetical protein
MHPSEGMHQWRDEESLTYLMAAAQRNQFPILAGARY